MSKQKLMRATTDSVKIPLAQFLKDNYFVYGKYVNFNRVIPAIDGLKPVHRRTLLGVRKVARNSLTSAVNAVGAIQVMHPFAQTSIEDTLGDMVRFGCLRGEGSWGAKLMEDIPQAATRYIQVGLKKLPTTRGLRPLQISALLLQTHV